MKNIILYSLYGVIMLRGSIRCNDTVKQGFYEYVNESDYSIVITGYYKETSYAHIEEDNVIKVIEVTELKKGHVKQLPNKGDSWQSKTFEFYDNCCLPPINCILSTGADCGFCLDSLRITFDHKKVLATKYDENGPPRWPDKYYASRLLKSWANYEHLDARKDTEVLRYTFTNEDYNHAEPIAVEE